MFRLQRGKGVSGFLEKIKRTHCGVARVMACCDSDREGILPCKTHQHCTHPFRVCGRLYRLHSFAFRPSNIFASPSAFLRRTNSTNCRKIPFEVI